MMKRVLILSLVALMHPSFRAMPLGKASHMPSLANKSVGPCHIETFGTVYALQQISEKAHVPIGVEADVDYSKEPTIVFDFPGGTVADLLKMFVSQAPDYTWEEATGIIHVLRDRNRLPLGDVVMDYPGVRHKTRRQISEDLDNRPEITAWLNSSHCTREVGEVGAGSPSEGAPISIEPRVISLRDLLDEVAIKSGKNFWAILQFRPSDPCRAGIWL